MKGFAVIRRLSKDEASKKFTSIAKLPVISSLIPPRLGEPVLLNGIIANDIFIIGGMEKTKIKLCMRQGIKKYGYVLSKDYNINYNPFFHHSCLIRGLDFLTVKLGCDMRLNEVVIADAATLEGKNIFRLLLPIARRIILVTDRKSEIEEEVKYAIMRYGISAAVVEDPIKASENADVAVISSDKEYHKYIIQRDIPVLFIKFMYMPKSNWCFDDVSIQLGNIEMDTFFVQGYLDVLQKKPYFGLAEKDGFKIDKLKMNSKDILIR